MSDRMYLTFLFQASLSDPGLNEPLSGSRRSLPVGPPFDLWKGWGEASGVGVCRVDRIPLSLSCLS